MSFATDTRARAGVLCIALWVLVFAGCGGGQSTSSSGGSAPAPPPLPPSAPPPTNTIAGGITGLAPTQALGNDEVSNSGFESGSTNWNLPACFSIDPTHAHTGSKSLLFTAASGCASPSTASTPVTRGPGAVRSYTLQGWVMTSPGSDLQVKVSVHDQTLQGAVVGETAISTPGATWTFLQQTNIDLLPVHDGDTLSVQAIVVQGTTGMAWFDDLQLIDQQPLPISTFLLYPNYKGYLWGNGPQTIRLQVEVPNPTNMNVMATLQLEGGNTITTIQQPAQTTQELDFDGSGLAPGSYLVNTTLLDASGSVAGSYATYRIVKVSSTFQSTLTNYVDIDNFLVRKGQKHFVWGVYDRWSTHRCIQCTFTNETGYLQIPGFNGLTTVQNYADTLLNSEMNILPFAGVNVTPSNDQLTPWLAAVDSVGVGHLQIVNNWVSGNQARPNWAANIPDSQLWQMLTSTQAGKPGGLGYYTYDEPTSNVIPTVLGQWPTLSSGDPGGVLFGTLARVSQVFRWRDMADVMSCDPYPVGNVPDLDDIAYGATTSPPMVRTSIWTRQVVQQSYGSRAVWMVLQLFNLNNQFPTYTQLRTQAYKAIINGANGILWWGFVSQQGIEYEWDVVGNQQPYFDFKKLSQEVLALEPILISQPRPDLLNSVSNPSVEFLVKAGTNPAQTVVFASNFTESPIGNVTFSLSSTSPQNSVTVYGEGRTLPVANGSFTDSFNGYDVHVYLVQ
jgi:hypothetical protein